MSKKIQCSFLAVYLGFSLSAQAARAESLAWGENIGWVNTRANLGPAVQVVDDSVIGWMWSENAGWISLSCVNTASCDSVNWGVEVSGQGELSGYAWSENTGWISFSCVNTGSCGSTDFGVRIDPATGRFSGFAWSESAGWLSFSCGNTGSCAEVDYGARVPPLLPREIVVAPILGLETTEAGGMATFGVRLRTTPTDSVTLSLSSSDTSEGTVSPTELTFTPENALVTQTVTVTGVDDELVDGDVAYSVLSAAATSADPEYAGIDPPDVSLTNTDNDFNGSEIFSDGFESGDTGAWS